ERDIRCLADDGCSVVIALIGGRYGKLDCAHLMTRRLTVTGSTLRPRDNDFKAEVAHKPQTHAWPLIEEGKVKPIIHATFALSEADQAHTMMDAGEQIGKIILTV